MSDKELSELVDELRATIAASEGLSDEDRSHLDGIVGRIEDEADDDDEGIISSVEDAVARFEVEHVGLVRVINRIADALSAGGL